MKGTSGTRTIYQDWDEYFMSLTFLCAKLSRNPYAQVGACIVNNKKEIISTGYNDMLKECDNNKFYWYRDARNYLRRQSFNRPHAEVNALRNRIPSDVKNCTIYVTLFPCNECAKMIIQYGIKTVVYLQDKLNNYKSPSKMMFDAAGVTYRPKQIKINFSISDWDETNQLPQTPMKRKYPKQKELGNIINIRTLLILLFICCLILISLDFNSMDN